MKSLDTSTRKSLPLSARDLHDLATLRGSTAHRVVLSDLAGEIVTEASSDAAVLHAVWEAGIKAVRDRIEVEGYAEIAEGRDVQTARAAARRRRPSWADDE
ncbi:MAG: hypothetical protein ACR2K3_02090 [Nocardioides sp.]